MKAPEPDMDVAEEGNIFYKSEEINSKWPHMLYKVMHNQSTQLAEDHLKCLVERSWFISGGDFIEKKQKNHTTWALLYLLVTKSHNFLYNAKIKHL